MSTSLQGAARPAGEAHEGNATIHAGEAHAAAAGVCVAAPAAAAATRSKLSALAAKWLELEKGTGESDLEFAGRHAPHARTRRRTRSVTASRS